MAADYTGAFGQIRALTLILSARDTVFPRTSQTVLLAGLSYPRLRIYGNGQPRWRRVSTPWEEV